jgi:hypothetical protein
LLNWCCVGAFWQSVLVGLPCCLHISPVLELLLHRLFHPCFLGK